MKKIILLFITITILMTPLTAVHCEDNIKVLINGAELSFDVAPQIIGERTMVPMRAIFEALGATVDWDGDAQKINAQRGDIFVVMTIGENLMTVGDIIMDNKPVEIPLDVPPQIIDGRTLVPIRAVSESLNCDVDWDGETRTVIISSGQSQPEKFPVRYDDTAERDAGYMRDFKILSCEKNDAGKYVISYTLRTFLEGRGDVIVKFDCVDENGAVVDGWEKAFRGTDYTWSWQEDTVTVSDRTAEIKFIKKEEK